MKTDDVELWFADLRLFRDVLSSAADTVLGPEELARAQAISAEIVRANFVASCILVRYILGARLGVPPHTLEIIRGEHGKPALASTPADPPLQFNLSHGGDAWLCGVSTRQAIGVDVETRLRVPNAERLATRVFCPREQDEFAALSEAPSADRDAAFLRGWTRKEAALKAVGSGFSSAAREIDVGFDTAFHRASLPNKAGWEAGVWSIEMPVAGFGAIAVVGERRIDQPASILRHLVL